MSFPALVEPRDDLPLTNLARYTRHLSLPGIGVEGQRRIANARVLLVGAGGLGSPIANYLIAAGLGQLSVIDADTVELSNLQRQILHRVSDAGLPKVDSVARLARELNPQVQVSTLEYRLDETNALELFAAHDLVIDGSDNFSTRYVSSDAAEMTGTPLVWGTIFQFSGQVAVFDPRHGAMLRDIFPEVPDADSVPSCAEGGVLGALCGIVGSLMATEALKLITGAGEPLIGRLWLYDALEASTRVLSFSRDPGRVPVTELVGRPDATCSVPSGKQSLGQDCAGREASEQEIDPVDLELLRAENSVLLIDVRADWEYVLAAIPGSVRVPLEEIIEQGWGAVPLTAASDIVLACKSGARSLRALQHLASAPRGSETRVLSLRGGTLNWLAEIQGRVVTY
ncbi:adenylyltransferase/sulfurtransferase MoeZ [Arthrobacter sp. MYb227]|uniref:ThiF family adenylyltransferase n=1 Tax=Arthrobacter sp. MYb227 TaxID=1848601 RepID=UPI000CFDA262|nr:ThiF family adenylyltransferase [Arthrobacter sp. MYb227]PQZ95118.1 adenylyltransferase/sulfurtransferase MoeZ [Arthrobacter sp. MYb227]